LERRVEHGDEEERHGEPRTHTLRFQLTERDEPDGTRRHEQNNGAHGLDGKNCEVVVKVERFCHQHLVRHDHRVGEH